MFNVKKAILFDKISSKCFSYSEVSQMKILYVLSNPVLNLTNQPSLCLTPPFNSNLKQTKNE